MQFFSDAFVQGHATAWETMAPGVRRQILTYDDSLMLVRVEFEAGGVGAPHQHVHSQATYIESGEFEIVIDGKAQVLKAGDSFYVSPNLLHGATARTAGVLLDTFSPIREDFMVGRPAQPAQPAQHETQVH